MPAWQGWCKYCWSCSCYTTWAHTNTNTNGKNTNLKKMDTSMYCTVQSILLILSYLATFRHVYLWEMGSTCECTMCTLQLDIVYSPGHCLMRPRILQMLYQAQISRGVGDYYRIGQFGVRNFWFSWPVSNFSLFKILFSIVANETMWTICSEGWVIMQEQC